MVLVSTWFSWAATFSTTFPVFVFLLALWPLPVTRYEVVRDVFWEFGGVLFKNIPLSDDNVPQGRFESDVSHYALHFVVALVRC